MRRSFFASNGSSVHLTVLRLCANTLLATKRAWNSHDIVGTMEIHFVFYKRHRQHISSHATDNFEFR